MSGKTRANGLATGALVISLAVGQIGCGNGKVEERIRDAAITTVSAKGLTAAPKRISIDELRGSLVDSIITNEKYALIDNSNVPTRLEFLGRSRNLVWSQHTESDVASFLRTNGHMSNRAEWPEGANVTSYTLSLILPRENYSTGENFLGLMQDGPKWYTERDVAVYSSTMLTFYGFSITEDGKQTIPTMLNYVSVISHDMSLPEGRLNGMSIYLERERAGTSNEVKLTAAMKSAIALVRKEYSFGLLENYYQKGIDAFSQKTDSVGRIQKF